MDIPNTLPPRNRNINIGEIYTKDVSFETPNSPLIFRKQRDQAVKQTIVPEFYTNISEIEKDWYEVTLTVTVKTTIGEEVAYLIEVTQAGIFNFSNNEEENTKILLESFCPRLLFPYARETISGLVQKGGFKQLSLPPIEYNIDFTQPGGNPNINNKNAF